MSIEARVKRILVPMVRFKIVKEKENNSRLGKVFGIYDNSPESDSLTICENGISWTTNHNNICVLFNDIKKTSIEGDKSSENILIYLKNNEIIKLPVRGKNGRFSDIFEFLRFLDRVLSELK
ncbi:hypothetical protein A9G29_10375 [Gilliamella sp. Fer2-1]|jgi:hypothetical protein|nr:hypothetical protein A9G29_10375 [Gilliamella apicola]